MTLKSIKIDGGLIMKLTKLLLTGSLIVLFFSCSPYHVKIDYDNKIDFANFKTYKWIKPKIDRNDQSVFTNSMNIKRFATAIEEGLALKGFTRIEEGIPDLNVVCHIRMKKKIDITSYGYSYWAVPGRVTGYTQYRTYEEGSLVIDFIDAKDKQLVWRGAAESVLKETEDVENLIYSVVEAILEDFPPED